MLIRPDPAHVSSHLQHNHLRAISSSLTELQSLLSPILAGAETFITSFAADLTKIFEKNSDGVGTDLLQVTVTFIKNILALFRQLLEALLKYAADIIPGLVDSTLNTKVDIPFFGAIWEDVFNQQLPTILDIACALVAAPVPICMELLSPLNKTWPDLSSFASAFQSLNVGPSAIEDTFNQLNAFVQSDAPSSNVNGGHNHDSLHGKEHAKTVPRATDTQVWNNYSNAAITVHALTSSLQAIQTAVEAAVPNEQLPNFSAQLTAVLSAISCAVSFPNRAEIGTQSEPRFDAATSMDTIVWSTRLSELITILALNDTCTPVQTKQASIMFGAVEFALSFSACCLRLEAINSMKKATGDPKWVYEAEAIKIEFAEALAGFTQKECDCFQALGLDGVKEAATGALFGTVSVDLDMGRSWCCAHNALVYRALR